MLVSTQGYIFLKCGKIRYKNVSDLKNACYNVTVKCDDCMVEFETIWSNRVRRISLGRNDLCRKCAHEGKRNSQYGKDRKDLCKNARSFVKNHSRIFSDDTKNKMSISKITQIGNGSFNIKSNNRGRKIWHFSEKNNKKFHADSALEAFRMIQLDNDNTVIKWTKHHCLRIKYEYKGTIRNTVPDFLIYKDSGIKIIEEVKGNITEQEIIKKIAIENYCLLNNFQFSFKTQKELNKTGEYRKFLKTLL